MSGRPFLLDLQSRNGPICRTCLLAIRQKGVPPRIAAYSSQATSKTKAKQRSRINGSISRRPTHTELGQYLQGIKDLQQQSTKDEEGQGFSVRFFEQDEHTRSELPNDDAFDDSVGKLDGSELKEALRDIQAGLQSKEEKDAFQAVLREVGGDTSSVGSATDLEKMMERMEAYTRSIDAEIASLGSNLPKELLDELQRDLEHLPLTDEGSGPRVALPQISEKPWTPNQRKKVNRLNLVLARAFRESRREPKLLTKNTVSAVYKAYHAARLVLARGWGHVSINVWDLLWTVLSSDESINIHRLAHVSLLARDMSEARVTLSPSQQLVTIEAVFVDGWEAKAIENWKRCVSTLGDEKSEVFRDYWELGVRIFCRTADLSQAERAADKLLSRRLNPRILMPLIRTWSEKATPESQEQAWAAYRRMRDLLGKEMKLSDYDQVISYFLTTNQTENALYAFVDMMSDGEIDLKKQKYMPSIVANKFFLGKWLKRLIGAGDLDGAFSVVEFMRKRGVAASPIHLNGLIGAWQRSGGVADLDRADRLAWEMIASRVRFVRSRDASPAEPVPVAAWPRATLETFSLMAENYRRRELHARMESLWGAFRESDISPDAFMMNQLLESHLQAGQPKDALDLYRRLVTQRGISPDPYTFSALWKTLPVNRLHIISPSSLPAETTSTRQLFSETARFRSVFEPDGMDGQLARKILHTFRRLGDKAGFLVALAALKQVFGFSPPETLAVELVLGTTKLSWDSAPQRKRLILAKRTMDNELLAWAAGDASKLEGEARGDALYAYLQKKFSLEGTGHEQSRQILLEAAREMGVDGVLAAEE
ncbi:hypothetical protein ED733_005097 [Metarhizium rileyi]|uniref:Pentatricopeptide repeat containing protein n=1 Tax=Metarhizium rileyi (strain RCEF 4871) TaxID=1649241 RepID=A0A5C6GN06_METRR|nr:hypothetical protein ED733_005097 [Metarhizium rileyi]